MKQFLQIFFLSLLMISSSSTFSQNLALNFDGVDDIVTVPNNNIYNVGTGNFTFEAWINMDLVQTTFPTVLSKRLSNNVNSGFLIMIYQGKLFFQIGGANIGQGTINIQDNQCHHIAVVRNSSVVTFYVDGVADGTFSNITHTINTTHPLWIGRDEFSPTTTMFKGKINELRYWNSARTQAQIQASMNVNLIGNEPGLVGYWKMNEGSGQTVSDFSQLNNDGYLGTSIVAGSTDPTYVTGCLIGCTPPPAVITSNGTVLCTGTPILLSANTGTGYTYQWYRSTLLVSGATSSTYSATISGTYTCVVTANGCSIVSNAIQITSTVPSVSLSYSGPTTFCTGSSLLLTRNVFSNGGTAPAFQWLLAGSPIAGATDSSYNVTQTGQYSVRVTNTQTGCVGTSYQLTVNVLSGPPAAAISIIGNDTSCYGVYMYASPTSQGHTYQWQKNNINIPGATNYNLQSPSTGNYRCVVTNACGSANSNSLSIYLTGTGDISVTGSTSFCSGGVSFTAPYFPNAIYQWYNNNIAIPGEVYQSLFTNYGGNYSCSINTSTCGLQFSTNTILVSGPGGILPIDGSTSCTGPVELEAIGGTGATYQWKFGGSNIPGATSVNYNAAASGNYSCEINNVQCGTTLSNTVTVTIGSAPQVQVLTPPIGFNSFDNCGGMIEVFANPPNQGTYEWYIDGQPFGFPIQSGTGNSLYLPPTGYYAVSLITPCGTTTDYFAVRDINTPLEIFSTEESSTICDPGITYLDIRPVGWQYAYSPQWNSYQWRLNGVDLPGEYFPILYPSQDGVYSCVVTNTCGTACCVDSIDITIVPPIVNTVTASGPLTFCLGQSVTLSVPLVAGYNYLWYRNNLQLSITTNTIDITTAGTYRVRIQNLCGTVYSADQVVTTTQNMTVTLQADNPLYNCNNTPLLLTATTGNGYTYQWYKNSVLVAGAGGPNFVATQTGNYSARVTNSSGCYNVTNTQQVVIGNSIPNISTNSVMPVCSTQNVSFTANAYGPGNTYQWKLNGVNLPNGTGGSVQVSAEAGNLTVDVTNLCGTQVSTPYVITVNPLPPAAITAGGPTSFCAPGGVVLNANTGSGISYQWNGPSGTVTGATLPTYTATVSGTYSVRENYTGFTCFKYSNTIVVNSTNIQAVITPSSPVNTCNTPVLLSAPTGSGYTYQWRNSGSNISGASSSTYNATTTGSYSVGITSSCGSTTSSPTNVNIFTAPPNNIITTGNSTTFCEGTTGFAWLSAGNILGATYQWQKNGANIAGATNYQYQAFSSGTYTCVKTNACGTITSTPITLTAKQVPLATLTPAGPVTFCNGGSVVLNANTGTGYTYQWKKNNIVIPGSSSSYTATSGGTYTCVVTRPNGCSATSNYVNVTVTPLTAAVIPQSSTAICPGTYVTLTAYPSGATSYQWQKFGNNIAGATGATYATNKKGNYRVIVTNSCGTSTSPNVAVTVITNPAATITAGGPTTFCAGQSVDLTANTYAGVTYQWQKDNVNISGANSQIYTASTSGNYRVRETANGCNKFSNIIAVTVNCRLADPAPEQLSQGSLTILPNPFSERAILVIEQDMDLNNASLEIYDASGKMVYGPQPVKDYEIPVGRNALRPGLYLLRLITEGSRASYVKFIVE